MMKNRYRGISVLVAFLMLVVSGCGRNGFNSEDEISVALSTENSDPDEKYLNYLQECIADAIFQTTDCSSAYSDIEMAEDGTIAMVEIHSGEYVFSDTEKDSIVHYIEKLDANQNVEVIFDNEAQELSSNDDSLKNTWYETRYYPIYMGGPEWGKHGMEETFDVNNPPLDLLFSMPSDELAALLFESPYLTQMLDYFGEDGHIDYSTMFGFLELHSDIFYELLRREDGIMAILEHYQNSEIDIQWFEDENYDSVDKKWLAEVFGSQFIRSYSVIFTKEETDLAKQIISEKNNVYLNTKKANQEYFNVSDIEYHDGNRSGDVRVMYMAQDEISERENDLKNT